MTTTMATGDNDRDSNSAMGSGMTGYEDDNNDDEDDDVDNDDDDDNSNFAMDNRI